MSRAADWKQRNVADAYRGNWETPPALFAQYDAEFHFTIDVCATAENAKCSKFFTPDDDGLTRSWAGERCWMNPPYGRQTGKWIAKAHAESQRGALVVCFIPSRTDTTWWHDHIDGRAEVRFLRGRVRFVGAPYVAPFPSAIRRSVPERHRDLSSPSRRRECRMTRTSFDRGRNRGTLCGVPDAGRWLGRAGQRGTRATLGLISDSGSEESAFDSRRGNLAAQRLTRVCRRNENGDRVRNRGKRTCIRPSVALGGGA